uniref:G-protein coupled receptors family 1 profile domain-containing protein n=1 Tax=Cavia porcellus TaxID=10141 RepID=H0WDP8_CAVPO
MSCMNQMSSSDFILLGLLICSKNSLVFFSSVLLIFILIVTENTLLILLIHGDSQLCSPMYFLLKHLSFMDIFHISRIVPKIITNFLSGSRTISFAGCGFQIFLSLTLLGGKCLFLAVMPYNCYVAICHPLLYAKLMSDKVSVMMAAEFLLVVTLNSIVHTAHALHFPFCHCRTIDHFCEVPAMLKLSCVNTFRYEQGACVSSTIFLLIPYIMISASYVQILLIVFQTKSSEARKKFFSTCSFHMVVVVIYYGPFIFTYLGTKSYHTPGEDKFLAVFYTIPTPTLNPAIYSFRNKDVLKAMKTCSEVIFIIKGRKDA